MSAPTNTARVLARGDGYRFGLFRDVYVLEWTRAVTLESLEQTLRQKQVAIMENPGGLIVLNLLTSAAPSPEVRERASRIQDEDVSGTICHATVVEEGGFRAGAIRAALTGLYLASKQRFPRKVFSNVPEAMAWCASQARKPAGWAVEVCEAIATLRGA